MSKETIDIYERYDALKVANTYRNQIINKGDIMACKNEITSQQLNQAIDRIGRCYMTGIELAFENKNPYNLVRELILEAEDIEDEGIEEWRKEYAQQKESNN